MDGTAGRPADTGIAYGHGMGEGKYVCYDVVGVGSSVEQYITASADRVGGSFEAAVARKLRGARTLTGDLIVVPMPFNSQGGLHGNWKETYRQWALRWLAVVCVSHSAAGRDDADDASFLVRNWMGVASTAIQLAQFRLTARMLEAAGRLGPHGVEPLAWRPNPAPPVGLNTHVLPVQ